MISLKNQYVCKLDIGDIKDFVYQDDLIELLYVEDASMALPTIELSFVLRDDNVANYLNSGSILTVGIGRDELSMLDLQFRIITDFSNKRPSVGQVISVSGLYYDYDFTSNTEVKTYAQKTSLEVVEEEAKRYFPIVKTNIVKTNDRQDWQKHETGWSFLKRVCSRGYVNSNTFLMSAFDNDTFYYYDTKELMKKATSNPETMIIFSKEAIGNNVINYNTASITGDSGVTSQALGNDQAVVEYNWENYTINSYIDNALSFTSLDTNALPLTNTGSLDTTYRDLLPSEDSSTNIALTQNAKNLLLNSNIQIFISFSGQFKTLNLLDIVLLDNTADTRIVGLSMVSKIAYQIINSNLYTNITLVRESFNNIKGEDLQNGSI